MITWFLSKNKTRLTTPDELVDVIVNNKDLLYGNGMHNIGGIMFYHFIRDDDVVCLSYGTCTLQIDRHIDKSIGKMVVSMNSTLSKSGTDLECLIKDDTVQIYAKGGNEDIPFSAFESETDFFQYTLLNLQYKCSDESLIKLIKFLTGYVK